MASKRIQVSISTLLMAMTFLAIGIGVFALPGGVAIYLPILIALLLCLAIWKLGISQRIARSRTFVNRLLFYSAIVLLAVGSFYYSMFSGEALAQYKLETEIVKQRRLVYSIPDTNRFEADALALHAEIAPDTPSAQVFVKLDDPRIPHQISRLNPTEISAGVGHLLIRMKPNGTILAYPVNSKMPVPTSECELISSRVIYWENR